MLGQRELLQNLLKSIVQQQLRMLLSRVHECWPNPHLDFETFCWRSVGNIFGDIIWWLYCMQRHCLSQSQHQSFEVLD
jgi:hypothetical protein